MNEIVLEKKELRKIIRDRKREYSIEEKKSLSQFIWQKVKNLEIFTKAKTILLYWSMDDEVFTHDFIENYYLQKTILLPCVQGNDLILRQYQGKESMRKGDEFGILEPIGKEFTELHNIDMIIVPGVAFDTSCQRMGRGRGFYDRLLKSTNCTKIGVCFDFQLVDSVPTNDLDVKMDIVISSSKQYNL